MDDLEVLGLRDALHHQGGRRMTPDETVKPKNRCCGNCRHYENAQCQRTGLLSPPNDYCFEWGADE